MLRRGIAAAFPSWRDRLTLAALAPISIGLLHANGVQALLDDWRSAGAIGALLGWAVGGATQRRLAWHQTEGLLAHAALDPTVARIFLALHVAAGALALAAALLLARAAGSVAPIGGYVAGAAAGLAVTALYGARGRRWRVPAAASGRRPLSTIAAKQLPFGWSVASVVMVLVLALAVTGAGWAARASAPLVFGLGAAAPLLRFGRVDDAIARFLALTGQGAGKAVLLHLFAGGTYLAVLLPLAALVDVRALGVVAATGAAFALLVAARVWLYFAMPRRRADTVLLLASTAAALVGGMMPPLLVVLLAYLLWQFYRRAAAARWIQP